ncbi:MAG: type II toxin-antitoxin system VapC family toxin [Anaerolineae bacterium]|nr:type II toxin-antitoxin system VapC family toxin [Anaerolineae bacterium]
MYTIDASVHVSALNPTEADSTGSRVFLAWVWQQHIPLFCPTLLLVEIAAAVARTLGDAERAVALAEVIRSWPGQTLVSLDEVLASRAVALSATAQLRGGDAVYAAVAQQYGTTLVTLDRQQLERLPPLVKTVQPADLTNVAPP